MSRRKFCLGRMIRSMDDLMEQPRIYWKPTFPVKRHIVDAGWFKSWQLSYAARQVMLGNCFTAKEIKEAENG